MNEVNMRMMAEEMHLSVSTISKALSDSHEISSETKRKVLEMASKLQYRPNPYASSLRRKKSNTIAIVVPEVADSYFSIAINGIESVARDKNYHVIVYLTHESAEREASILQDLGSGRVDGVLISMSSDTSNIEAIKALHDRNIPIIFFDRVSDAIPTATISTNDYESGYAAAEHLIEQGCKKIAFLSVSNSLSVFNKRMQGYSDAIKAQGNDGNEMIVACGQEAETCQATIHALFSSANRPDAVIASVEKLATPVYETCYALGLKIPGDLRIVCFSNQSTATVMNPPLTTITQPAFEMGQQAATLMFKALTKSSFSLNDYHPIIPSTLIKRAST